MKDFFHPFLILIVAGTLLLLFFNHATEAGKLTDSTNSLVGGTLGSLRTFAAAG